MSKFMEDAELQKRIRRQVEGLYDNEALTSDMDDASASEVMKWAAERTEHIVRSTEGMDEQTAEEAIYPRMKAVRRMARTVNQMAREEETTAFLVEKLLEQAREVYGESFKELDETQKLSLAHLTKSEPVGFVQTLKKILEGETDVPEEETQQRHPPDEQFPKPF